MRRFFRSVLPLCAAAIFLGGCVTEGPGSELTKFKKQSSKERHEESVRIKTQLAVEYIRAKDYRAATAAIEEAIRENSRYDMAWLVRAQIYQFLKVPDKAEESFRQALSISPNGAEINNSYGWFLCSMRNQPNAAMPYFDRALADPTYPGPEVSWLNKGVCSAKQGAYDLAESYFERALNLNPEFIVVHKERARAKLMAGNVAEADRNFRVFQRQVEKLGADDLYLGWKIAKAQGKKQEAYEYEAQLRSSFPYSEELQKITTGSE